MKNKQEAKLIAAFMGYTYFEEILVDDSDCGGIYRKICVYSKIPIGTRQDGDDVYFKQVPNPDYGNEDNPKWNRRLEKLSWSTINHDQCIYDPEYDTDWNQLMSVINRINELVHKNQQTSVFIGRHSCVITPHGLSTDHFCQEGETRKEACYKTVVEFLEWYSKQDIK